MGGPLCKMYGDWQATTEHQGIFLDWCSLFQQVRSAEQNESFGRSLKHINIWYAHVKTLVLLVTKVPAGVRPYDKRGWPTFERAVSQMLTPSDLLWDLGGLPENYQSSDVVLSRPVDWNYQNYQMELAWHRVLYTGWCKVG